MNPSEMRAMRREIIRTRKLARGLQQAAEQMMRDLDNFDEMLQHFIKRDQPPTDATERAPRGGRVTKSAAVTSEADVLRVIEKVFGIPTPVAARATTSKPRAKRTP